MFFFLNTNTFELFQILNQYSSTMGRGVDYSEDEDIILTMAWLEISEDAVTGAEQKADSFWDRVKTKYQMVWKSRRGEDKTYRDKVSLRSATALKSRWTSRINHDCQKFGAYYQKVVNLNESGKTKEDRIAAAQKFFVEDIGWNDTKREFQFMSCWELLSTHPKWSYGTSPLKRKLESDESEGESNGGGKRPKEGRKKAKLMKSLMEKEGRAKEQCIITTSQRIALAAERKASAIELLCEIQQASLFSIENGCTEEERNEYFALMRQRVRSRNSVSAKGNFYIFPFHFSFE